MHFYVSSITYDGQNSSDIYEALDQTSLLENLEARKKIPTNIIEIPAFLVPLIPQGGHKIKPDDIVELMDNLHLVIKSGLPLHQGLLDIAQDTENKRYRIMLEQIAYDLNRGKSLSKAFEMYENIVGVMILNLIRIGEETGQLEATLKRGSEFLKRTTELKKKAKSALIYPSFAFVAVSAAMLVWMIYVLPQMTSLFKDMDVELPALTIFMIDLSTFLANDIGYLLAGLVILIVTFKILHKKNIKVRILTDTLMLKIPVIKNIISGFNIAFISEYLKLALVSGVPLFTAIDTLKNNINNELFKEALSNVTRDVEGGSQLSSAFEKTKIFTTFVIRLMSVGESAGTLDAQLEIISKYYYEKVDFFADNI
ncbi:MAG TPA: type II secretion system F family protein [Epsilonproteobacteria bacterium]|nr:type II secretion system F family protein [Campylobacterota bacterium]